MVCMHSLYLALYASYNNRQQTISRPAAAIFDDNIGDEIVSRSQRLAKPCVC